MKKTPIFIFLIFISVIVFSVYAQNNEKQASFITLELTGKNIKQDALREIIGNYLIQTGVVSAEDNLEIKNIPQNMRVNSSALIDIENKSQDKKIKLKIKNYDLPDIEPVFLMFSNYPEKVSSYGVLFSAACIFRKKVRQQFYHLSKMENKNPYFSLRFYNPSKTKTAKIYILGDMQAPGENYMKIGHQNNRGFLNKKNNKLGIIYEIKPDSVLTLFNQEAEYNKLFSGIYEMYLLEGEPVWFYIFSNKTKDEKLIYPEVTSVTDTHAKGVYMVSDFNWDVNFDLTEKEKYIVFGDMPLRNIFPQKKLAGDYGTIYNINVSAKETKGKSGTGKLEIIFQPRGGIATGTFIIDGRVIEAPFTKPKVERKIWSYKINPHERRLINIKTMPEGSSYYPIRIIFRFVE